MSIEEQYKKTLEATSQDSTEVVRLSERSRYEDKIAEMKNLVRTQQLEIASLRRRLSELEETVPPRETSAKEETRGDEDEETQEHQRLLRFFMENRDIAGLTGYVEQHERVVAERAAREASRDPLTQLPNRRSFNEDAGKTLAAVQEYQAYHEYLTTHPEEKERRTDEPVDLGDFSVIFIDLDHFKSINDSYGHAAGDEVLRRVADVLREVLRPTDEVARYGGEEFVVAFTSHRPGARVVVAEKIREAIARVAISFNDIPIPVTASLGAAKWRPGERLTDVLQSADLALYEAKSTGRDRVVVDSVLAEKRAGVKSNFVD